MATWKIILMVLAGGLALAIAAEAWLKRNRPRRPLAEKFLGDRREAEEEEEEGLPLGMEAVDLEVLREAERSNRHAAQLGARDIPFWSRRMRRALAPGPKKNTAKTPKPSAGPGQEKER